MKNSTINSFIDQQLRMQTKSIGQQMKTAAIKGTGMSSWEADVLLSTIDEIYLPLNNEKTMKHGQIKYLCVSSSEGPGKPLVECEMTTVILTLFEAKDEGQFSDDNNKDRSVELRRRRLVRLAEESKEQLGYLSQEDLAQLLMCHVRTIRRDIKELKRGGIIVPCRGQQKDIGPGISHRAIAIRLWIEGKEQIEIARSIKHSVAAVDIYIQKFKRVAFLRSKGLEKFEIALAAGLSNYATETFLEIYEDSKGKCFFNQRLKEIELLGVEFNLDESKKKDARDEKINEKIGG